MITGIGDRGTLAGLRRSSRHAGGAVWVRHLDDGSLHPRVAYALGRSLGGAVSRNRVRRRLRALLDELDAPGRLAPGAYLIGVTPASLEHTFDTLRDELQLALERAGALR